MSAIWDILTSRSSRQINISKAWERSELETSGLTAVSAVPATSVHQTLAVLGSRMKMVRRGAGMFEQQ